MVVAASSLQPQAQQVIGCNRPGLALGALMAGSRAMSARLAS